MQRRVTLCHDNGSRSRAALNSRAVRQALVQPGCTVTDMCPAP
jgi:hypothetical protein